MQSMQRQFGKLLNKGPGNNAKVSVLLTDYEDADKILAQIVDGITLWRESWANLLQSQLGIVTEYDGLYDPIVGASDGPRREAVPTPELQLNRTFKLKEAYAELKNDLLEEVASIDVRIIRPAIDARDCISPIRKTIKKRENKRLDYEKCQDKVVKLQRKAGKTAKEESSLSKAEQEMSVLADEFQVADNHIRETLPPIIAASFNMVPPLLAGHVLIQNRLLGLYYTALHGYCEENGFPSPPPPMDEVISEWSSKWKPVQRQIESIGVIARGKGIHQPFDTGCDPGSRKSSSTSLAPANGARRASSGLIPPRPQRVPSSPALAPPSPDPSDSSPQPSPRPRPDYLAPTDFTTATFLGQSPGASPNSLRPQRDYFGSTRPSTASTIGSNGSQPVMLGSMGNGPVVKKKPPPPPPPKRLPSTQPEEFVVAQFSFTGQGAGDLSFRQGDRIKIVKKTNTDQDWWVGELDGRRGSFPANYCKAV